jgi:MFS family permease
MAITASVSGPLSDRIGTRTPTTIGMLIVSAGLFLLSRQEPSTSIPLLVIALLLTGLGIGLFTAPNTSAVLGAVQANRRGVANGVLGTGRSFGMLLGIGVAGAVCATSLSLSGVSGSAGVLVAADAGFLVGSLVALAAALASALSVRNTDAADA